MERLSKDHREKFNPLKNKVHFLKSLILNPQVLYVVFSQCCFLKDVPKQGRG